MQNRLGLLILATVLLSIIGFVVPWALNLIPYAGVFIALVVQFFLGDRLARCIMPIWSYIIVGFSTIAGFHVGFIHGTHTDSPHNLWRYILLIATLIFILGFGIGVKIKPVSISEV